MISEETLVGDPEKIRTISEVGDFLSRIISYERSCRYSAGVLLTQRRQFGPLYEIVSEQEAHKELKKSVRQDLPEFGIAYYPRTYFETLRQKLEGCDVMMPEPIRRRY